MPRTTNHPRIASIARSAERGSHHIGCWTSPRKARQIGATIITDAASSASTGTTTTTIGSLRILHCHLSPALPNKPGTAVSPKRTDYRHQDRSAVANLDADHEQYPKRWVIALDSKNQHQRKLYIEAMWSDNKFRWVRHVVIPRTNNPNQATTLDVDTFYKLCQKVITIRRREAGEQHRLRNTYWTAASEQIHQEHPGLNKAEVRAQVRARVLALVDRFTVDILSSTEEAERARIMAAFRQWDEDTIKSALDPDWDRHAFFQRIEADNNLTEWASKISDTMQQHYICRKIGCQAVIDNKHWLRKISPRASIKEQHGRYNCPHCLNAYRPWIQQTDLVPAQKALIVAAPDTIDLAAPTGAQQLPVRQPVASPHTNYFLYLTEWEKKDEDRLLQQLKLAILNIQQEITDRDDFNNFITQALKDVANKNQPLPYFVRETWPKNNIVEINSRNVSGANPPYRLDLLPTTKYPDKFFREEFNSADTARNYGLVEYLNDPPYYDMTTYTYEAGVTQIMTQKDFCRFLGLTYLRLRLAEDHAAGRLRSTTKRSAADMDTSM